MQYGPSPHAVMGPPPPPGSTGPPPQLSNGYHVPNVYPNAPNVRLPIASNSLYATSQQGGGAALMASSSGSPIGYGYTPAHGNYLQSRAQKQVLSYAPSADHRIMLEFRGVTRKPGAAAPKPLWDLYYVQDKVKVSIGAHRIKALAWEKLAPRWRVHTNDFPLTAEECHIYNKNWVEIIPKDPDINVISEQFYKANPKNPAAPIFKTGKYRVDLCIPWAIVEAFEAYQLQAAAAANANDTPSDDDPVYVERTAATSSSKTAPPSSKKRRPGRPKAPTSQASTSTRPQTRSKTRPVVNRSEAPNTTQSTANPLDAQEDEDVDYPGLEDFEQEQDKALEPSGSNHPNPTQTPSAHSRAAWAHALSQQIPPSKQEIGSLLSLTTLTVHASVAKQLTLNELLVSKPKASRGNLQSYLEGPITITLQLDLRPKSQKVGGFKMACFGQSFPPLFADNSICAKRSFYTTKGSDGVTNYLPHPTQRQSQDLMTEMLCSTWAAALLENVYDNIDRFLAAHSPGSLQTLTIPRMRFVRAAFAAEGKQLLPASSRALFLLEERIHEESEGKFRKYINNRAPIPTSFPDGANYKLTHGLAFVSDYQGGDTLLTDPQVMSDPSLGDIFATGNIPSGCQDFPAEHTCNKYCEYFKISNDFDPMPEAASSNDNGSQMIENRDRNPEPSGEERPAKRRKQ
ncbi:hypothetical protein B0H16DRAFT_1637812 [Mycena metata]|uniref:Alpha-type protein kinase domain-containing protein n=1 Tax=Mycena metata TaxID=1033252 RepID=A0AAD7GSC6_9AGAR|nr:hypothetical protein B0H16DRAFT_1637812 [Mycena metata]